MIRPDFYYNSIYEIPYERLYEQGLRALVYDIDNTLVTHADEYPTEPVVALIERLRKIGFKIALLSNNTPNRLNNFNKDIKLHGASMAAKPFTPGLRRVMRAMQVNEKETAIIGDQLFADVWCGQKAGVTTVLVKPITEKEWWTVRLKRGLERRMLKRFLASHVNPL